MELATTELASLDYFKSKFLALDIFLYPSDGGLTSATRREGYTSTDIIALAPQTAL